MIAKKNGNLYQVKVMKKTIEMDLLLERMNDIYDLLITIEDKVENLSGKTGKYGPALGVYKDAFLRWYESYYSNAYYWEAKDWVGLKGIVNKIKFKIEQKAGAAPTEEDTCKAFVLLLENIEDDWVLSNMSVPLLNSKLNEVISKMNRNGKTKSVNQISRLFDRIDQEGN